MVKYKVVVTDLGYSTYEPEKEVLNAIGAELILTECKNEDEIIQLAKDADALIARRAHITEKVVGSLTKCIIITRYGVGYDNIDHNAAAKRGIPVANVPDYCMEEVSDHALALMLSCARKITSHDKLIRQGAWNISGKDPVFRIRGKVMGIVGLGRIGSAFLRKVKAFDFKEILVADPYIDKAETEKMHGVKIVPLHELLKQSDYVSLHVPLTEETHNLIGENEFKIMKPTAILINTARGPVVDETALFNALRNKVINSAGIDVYVVEPVPQNTPLFALENIVVSDHAAWYSEDSEMDLKRKMAENVANALTGKEIRNIVNNPY